MVDVGPIDSMPKCRNVSNTTTIEGPSEQVQHVKLQFLDTES